MKALKNRGTAPWASGAKWACRLSLAACTMALPGWGVAAEPAPALKTVAVQSVTGLGVYAANATVEAVRDTRVSAQVSGRIVELLVKAGDHVQAGQVLVRLDQSAANQQVAGSLAQVAQAQAMLAAAKGDHERAQLLYKKEYLSKAALDHAEAQYKAVVAQARALSAQASGTTVQAAYYTVRAPYAAWVSQVSVSVGDMASPGLPLMSMFDPAALRLTVQVPESVASKLDVSKPAMADLPGPGGLSRSQPGLRTTVLPALDATTHSAKVRVDMAAQTPPLVPGQFARVALPLKVTTASHQIRSQLMVPNLALVERGELTGVYVVTDKGGARLRQVRLGRVSGLQTEVLSGLQAGEQVALDPVAAAQAAAR